VRLEFRFIYLDLQEKELEDVDWIIWLMAEKSVGLLLSTVMKLEAKKCGEFID